MSGDSDKQHQLLYYPLKTGTPPWNSPPIGFALDSLALAAPLLALRSLSSSLCHIRPHRSVIIDGKYWSSRVLITLLVIRMSWINDRGLLSAGQEDKTSIAQKDRKKRAGTGEMGNGNGKTAVKDFNNFVREKNWMHNSGLVSKKDRFSANSQNILVYFLQRYAVWQ